MKEKKNGKDQKQTLSSHMLMLILTLPVTDGHDHEWQTVAPTTHHAASHEATKKPNLP